jgi:hypothetical protein
MSFKSKEQQRKCYIMTARDQAGSWNCKAWSKSASFRSLPKRKKEAAWVVANYLKYAASLRPELSRGYEKAAKAIFSGSNLPKAIKRAFPTLKVLQVTKLSKLIIDSAADAQRLSKRASCGVGPTGSKIIKIRKKKPVSAKVTIVKKMAEDMEKEAFWGALLNALKLGGRAVPMLTRGAGKAIQKAPGILKNAPKGKRLAQIRNAFNQGSTGLSSGGSKTLKGYMTNMSGQYGGMGMGSRMGWSLPGAAVAGGALGASGIFEGGGGYGGGQQGMGGYGGGQQGMGGGYGGGQQGMGGYGSMPIGAYGGYSSGRSLGAGYRGGGGSNAYQDGMRDGRQSFKIKQLKRRKKRLQSKLKPPTAPAPAAPAPAAPAAPAAVASPSTRGGPLYAGEPAAAARLNA